MPPTAATLPDPIDAHHEKLRRYGGAFLAGFRNANTRTSYRQQLHRWFAWCDAYGIDPLTADRVHLELYCRWFEQQVDSINTVSHGANEAPYSSTDGTEHPAVSDCTAQGPSAATRRECR